MSEPQRPEDEQPVPVKSARDTRERYRQRPLPQHDRIVVSDEALATLIGLAAHEVPGIVGMAPANFGEGLRRVLGVSQANEGVGIHRSDAEPERASVDLYVVVAYGVNIPVVAESVRVRVHYAARTFAGVDVERVRVHVAGVSRA